MEGHEAGEDHGQKLRVLVAEDNEINQQVVQRILAIAGCRSDMVDNGRQAVELAARNQYDLILMDIQIPLMDGYEASKRIRKWECGMRNGKGEYSDSNSEFPIPQSPFKEVPIVIMTGNAVAAELETCRKLGINDCIGKPLSADKLLAMIRKWTAADAGSPAVSTTPAEAGSPPSNASPSDRPLDLDRALQEFMGAREVLAGLLEEFTAKAGAQIKAVQQAVRSRDYRAVAREAHSIKGAAGNLTADRMADVAAELETAADLNQDGSVKHLADMLAHVHQQLEAYLEANNLSAGAFRNPS